MSHLYTSLRIRVAIIVVLLAAGFEVVKTLILVAPTIDEADLRWVAWRLIAPLLILAVGGILLERGHSLDAKPWHEGVADWATDWSKQPGQLEIGCGSLLVVVGLVASGFVALMLWSTGANFVAWILSSKM